MSAPSSRALVESLSLELSATQMWQLAALLDVLEADARAPTAIRGRERAVDAHIADSLAALEVERLGRAATIADVGSGAGFPGLALAVALPRAHMRLVESQRRACEFAERARSAAGVENARTVCARVEDWREGLEAHDAVLARALAPQPVVLEYAAPLLRLGGTVVDWRGRRSREEERAAGRAAAQLGLELLEIRHMVPFAGARDRHLHVFEKVAATPERFPRRTGVARKRPLATAASDRDRG